MLQRWSSDSERWRRDIKTRLQETIGRLSYRDCGDLAVYWMEDGVSSEDVAERLGQKPYAIRVVTCRALKLHPCGENPRICAGVSDCAHQRGKAIWDRIMNEIVSDFRRLS
jgi:hypothetical protein